MLDAEKRGTRRKEGQGGRTGRREGRGGRRDESEKMKKMLKKSKMKKSQKDASLASLGLVYDISMREFYGGPSCQSGESWSRYQLSVCL